MELVIRYITEALPISGSNGFHVYKILSQGNNCDVSRGQILQGFLEQGSYRNVRYGKLVTDEHNLLGPVQDFEGPMPNQP